MIVPTERIRNVLVLGHTGTGKSTLVEAMLEVAGHPAAHGEGAATVDHEPEERERGHSLSLAIASVEFEGHRFNLLDAPGGAEAIGDAYRALLAADTALFVVDATVGVQPQHLELWRACEQRRIPRVVFLNKLDLERARYQERIAELQELYGSSLAPVLMPLGIHDAFDGVIDLLHEVAVEWRAGRRVEEPIPEARRDQAAANRETLVEALVENDDELLERYLEGEPPSIDAVVHLFAHGIATCGFFPVLCGSAMLGIGVELLLRFLIEECPSPAEAPHELPHDAPTVAYVLKTFSDQYVGRISVLRLLSGPLAPDDELTVVRSGEAQRLHQLFSLRGREQLPRTGAAAGDIVAVAKLGDVRTGDLLAAEQVELHLDVPTPPEGLHRVVVDAVSVGDDAKLSTALQRVTQEDPSVAIELDAEAGTRVLRFLGPTHVDVTVERLRRRYGVEVTVGPAPIAYRSTIRRAAVGTGRHVKQSGGHGQFGIVRLEVEPAPPGSGLQFENRIVGGVVPGPYIPSVEKGVREAMREGPLGGVPVVDVRVRLVDGKHHPVDSSDAAFQMAGILGFRAALAEADPTLLEPVMHVRVVVPDELTGAVLSDLAGRRGRILGTDASGPGASRVEAHVPEAELVTFSADLRALTSGRGEVTMAYDHHAEVPEHVARRVLEGSGD